MPHAVVVAVKVAAREAPTAASAVAIHALLPVPATVPPAVVAGPRAKTRAIVATEIRPARKARAATAQRVVRDADIAPRHKEVFGVA